MLLAWYESTGRQYLPLDGQQDVELRIHFMIYTLLRLKVCIVLYDAVAGLQVLPLILPSIIHIVRSWLASADDHQVWKDSFKFYFETAIICLFDVFQRIQCIHEYEGLIKQYSLRQLCLQVLEKAWGEGENELVPVVPISQFGVFMLENMIGISRQQQVNS